MGKHPDERAVVAATTEQRAALVEDLATLDDDDWARTSLCGAWTVEEVVAHLTAAASLGRRRWLASVLGARFDFDLHNARRLAEHRGRSPQETLARFEAVVDSTTSTFGPKQAWLGEVVIHGQDIRRVVGVERSPSVEVLTPLAEFLASRNFTVAGETVAQRVRLQATDGPFVAGSGPGVEGTTLALVMVMAGRTAFHADVTGPGTDLLGSPSPH